MRKKLPDAEFELMRVIWTKTPPVATSQIMKTLNGNTQWKPQTVLTLLNRLVERGYLRSERVGRGNVYYPLVTRADYLTYETDSFMKRFELTSPLSLVNTLYEGERLTGAEIGNLRRWLDERSADRNDI